MVKKVVKRKQEILESDERAGKRKHSVLKIRLYIKYGVANYNRFTFENDPH